MTPQQIEELKEEYKKQTKKWLVLRGGVVDMTLDWWNSKITTLLEKQREEDVKTLCKYEWNFQYLSEEEALIMLKSHDKTS
jgi:hypothetical protein